MRKCELCGGLARMRCESDQANLCWDCDVKVHGANFLVAKHTRTLLCHVCQNPTPWFASGQHLSSAVSVCESCVANNDNTCEVTAESEESSEADYDEEEEDYDDDEEEEEEEDAENQVVPWSGNFSSFSMTKPMASSDSSSSTEGGGGDGAGFRLKRRRRNLSFCSEDEIGCSSSHVGSGGTSNGEASSTSRLAGNQDHGETESRSTAIIRSLKRLQKHMIVDDGDASATIIGICRLSRDQSR
ncbi:hypothetical protein HRI_004187800 [Hibiscus trionum]|uniref:B box-type domain-containing protein n=1 Tax=Hibiscus trionum TaxID=183268 RepID=A0A9W7MPZ4_HIBTR|nr:hypothetical protein HRI_004187800 [Hibiscus trionum]